VIPLHGGARSRASHRIVTLGGRIGLARRPRVTTDEAGAPYVTLEPPAAMGLRLRQLQLAYGGAPLPALLNPQVDFTPEHPLLVPLILRELCRPLTELPISHLPTSFGVRLNGAAPSGQQAMEQGATGERAVVAQENAAPTVVPTLRAEATQAFVGQCGQARALLLGCALKTTDLVADAARNNAAPPIFGPEIGTQATSENVAVALSTAAINHLLAPLTRRGALTGQATLDAGAPTPWRWEEARLQFSQGQIHLSGQVTFANATHTVEAALECALDEQGRPVVAAKSVTGLPTDVEASGNAVICVTAQTISDASSRARPSLPSPTLTTARAHRFDSASSFPAPQWSLPPLRVASSSATDIWSSSDALPSVSDRFLPQPPELAPQVTITQLGTGVSRHASSARRLEAPRRRSSASYAPYPARRSRRPSLPGPIRPTTFSGPMTSCRRGRSNTARAGRSRSFPRRAPRLAHALF
jgi:hypothetical protein